MPDANVNVKRPPISAFGEGTVVKRPRKDAHEKPKSSDGRSANAKAISSAIRFPDNGFCVKPATLLSDGQRPQRPPGVPLNPNEALSIFKKKTMKAVTSKDPAHVKSLFHGLRPPETGTHFMQHQKRARLEPPIVQAEKQNSTTTPLASRIRPPDIRAPSPRVVMPVRRVVPFHALPVPVLDELHADAPSSSLKPLPPPNFDLGGRGKGKLSVMKGLEPPTLDLPEEKEVEGEALELQRGLLVSPEKGGRRRSRFIRNGLAERAQLLINRSSTALTLWKKDIEPSASRAERLHADLRLRVKNIIHVSRNANIHSRSAGTLRSVLATCTLPDGEECTVMFLFSHDNHDSRLPCSAELVKEDTEIIVWKPWQETVHPRTLFCSRFLMLSPSSNS